MASGPDAHDHPGEVPVEGAVGRGRATIRDKAANALMALVVAYVVRKLGMIVATPILYIFFAAYSDQEVPAGTPPGVHVDYHAFPYMWLVSGIVFALCFVVVFRLLNRLPVYANAKAQEQSAPTSAEPDRPSNPEQ